MTTRDFDVEEGKNVIWYQALRLFNEGLVPKEKVVVKDHFLTFKEKNDHVHGSDYSELKLVGVGGETGKEPIWEHSLLH